MYYIVLGFIATIIVALTVSAISGGSSSLVDPDLFTPIIAKKLKKQRLLIRKISIEMVNF